MAILQQWCACGAGIVAQADEKPDYDAWVQQHPRVCGMGFVDDKPMRVGMQCPGCGIYVYDETTVKAQSVMDEHQCSDVLNLV